MNCDFLSCYVWFFERNYNFNCSIEPLGTHCVTETSFLTQGLRHVTRNLGNVSGTANMGEIRSEGREILPNITVLLNCFNKVRKTDRIKMFFFSRETWKAEFIVREMWNGYFISHESWSIPTHPKPPPPPLYHPLGKGDGTPYQTWYSYPG